MINLQTDSDEYEILYHAAFSIKDVNGAICEIGTRMGGSLKHIIHGLLVSNDINRNIVCVDPYGNIDYVTNDTDKCKYDYTNSMRNSAYKNIYTYVENMPFNLVMLCMEDTEFFKRFNDGVPFYNNQKTIENTYSLVFYDGPHSTNAIKTEIEFFIDKIIPGSIFVFDDICDYNHSHIEDMLFNFNFKLLKKGKLKASYLYKP